MSLSSRLISTNEGFFTTVDLPMFRLGFRYYACEAYPEKPSAFRTIPYKQTGVEFSLQDRSPHVEFSADRLTVRSHSGYRSARTPEPIRRGTYYYEVRIDRGGEIPKNTANEGEEVADAHVRVGISRREAESGAPVGYDGYSYGWRDINGHKVHLSRSQKYSEGFKTGDVVGVLIHLPMSGEQPSSINRSRIPIKYKDNLWFELPEYTQTKEMELLMEHGTEDEIPVERPKMGKRVSKGIRIPRISGSYIEFYKNGQKVHNEPAYIDLLDYAPIQQPEKKGKKTAKQNMDYDDGTCGYYPMVSLFKGGQATLNPGPLFEYPPATDVPYKPLAARFHEFWFEEMQAQDDDACAKAPDFAAIGEMQLSGGGNTHLQESSTGAEGKAPADGILPTQEPGVEPSSIPPPQPHMPLQMDPQPNFQIPYPIEIPDVQMQEEQHPQSDSDYEQANDSFGHKQHNHKHVN